MEYSAQRVRAKTRAAVKRREDAIEQEEMESGELNLIPYLDMVTNLMLFLLASVSAGLILAQIDTTLPDKAPANTTVNQPSTAPDEQPLKLFVSIKRDEMILWSASGLEGTLNEPKPGYTFKRAGRDGEPCDGNYMCETNSCDANLARCVPSKDELAPVFEYRKLNDALFEIASRRYAGKQRRRDTYTIVLQADGAIPYSTIASVMAAMRCKLPAFGGEVTACALPTEDEALKKAPDPVAPARCGAPGKPCKLYDTARAPYDPRWMALFHDIQFSSGFE
ncbi:MAG: ExbD/TolR family protein [Kofleriaceae bacterium]